MKIKWNWIDTLVVCLVVIIVAALLWFFLRPSGATVENNENQDFYITFEAPKNEVGTYDAIKAGDEIFIVGSNSSFGVIESVEILPSQTSVFNESTKQLDIFNNEMFPVCHVKVKTNGYMNSAGAVYAGNLGVMIDDEWFLETKTIRFSAAVYKIEGVGNR